MLGEIETLVEAADELEKNRRLYYRLARCYTPPFHAANDVHG